MNFFLGRNLTGNYIQTWNARGASKYLRSLITIDVQGNVGWKPEEIRLFESLRLNEILFPAESKIAPWSCGKTPYTPRHPPLQALLSTDETHPSPLSGISIAACTLSDFVFDAFPRLRRAKGPNRERQALSSDRERVEQPPSLFTHD